MTRSPVLCLALVSTFALVACGHDSSPPPPTPPVDVQNPARGQLLQSPVQLGSFSATTLLADLSGSSFAAEILQLDLSPTCTVSTYHMQYGTVGGMEEPTTGSAALMIPSGSGGPCQGPFPIVVYAHGTSTDKAFNIADITASGSAEGLLMAAIFAAGGYIVVAPNYAGYDTSRLPYHPYLVADQQSKDMIDSLTAAQTALASLGPRASGQIFVTGYSQGGYVAMATARAMEAAGIPLTAFAPMSGPYALSAFGDAFFEGQVNSSGPVNFALLANGYQHSYGNLYSNPLEVFEPAYADGIDALLPSSTPISTLYAQGRLPSDALFASTPPDPAYALITPATQPANLAPVFAQGFGTDNLVTNAYRESYLQDAQTQPDGGFPTATTGLPPAAPVNTLRQDLKANDLRDWTPRAPVLLCGGDNDPTVFFFNTTLMQQYWAKNGGNGASIHVLDVDAGATVEDPYAPEKTGFAAAKGALALIEGDAGVRAAYHATLVPPFCLAAVKSFFDSH